MRRSELSVECVSSWPYKALVGTYKPSDSMVCLKIYNLQQEGVPGII